MKIINTQESIDQFLNIISKHDFYTVQELSNIFSVSSAYLKNGFLKELNCLIITHSGLDMVLNKVDNIDPLIQKKIKKFKPQTHYYCKANIIDIITILYEVEGEKIEPLKAEFLLEFQWLSLKQIKEKYNYKFDMQAHREVSREGSQYVKITTSEGSKTSLTRYVSVI